MEKNRESTENLGNTVVLPIFAPPYGIYSVGSIKKYISMYAIVEIAGHQYKVQKDQQVFVNRLDAKEGAKIKFDKVLLMDKDGT